MEDQMHIRGPRESDRDELIDRLVLAREAAHDALEAARHNVEEALRGNLEPCADEARQALALAKDAEEYARGIDTCRCDDPACPCTGEKRGTP